MKNIALILNYNDSKNTINLARKLNNYKVIYKIIIIDNNSTDNSYNIILKYKNEKIDVIKSDVNGGYAYGNNLAAKYAIRKYNPDNIIICNSDIEIKEKTLINLIKNIDSTVGAVTGIMKDIYGNISPYSGWKFPDFRDSIISSLLIFKKIFKMNFLYNSIYENSGIKLVDVLPGAFLIINTKAFIDVEYFDERTFLYHEENILFYKLKEKGYKALLDTNESFIHAHEGSVKKNIKNITTIYKINRDSFRIYLKFYKNYKESRLIIFDVFTKIGCVELLVKEFTKRFLSILRINRN